MLATRQIRSLLNKLLIKLHLMNSVNYDYAKTVTGFFSPEDSWENVFPTILPQWDRTARVGKADGVYLSSTPKKFQQHVEQVCEIIKNKHPEHQVIILESWNEWAEGNYIEPDLKFGKKYIQALHTALNTQK